MTFQDAGEFYNELNEEQVREPGWEEALVEEDVVVDDGTDELDEPVINDDSDPYVED